MAASSCQPVVVPRNYDPMFKVDVLLLEPLHDHIGSLSDLKVDVMSLCFQLESLCKQEYLTQPDRNKLSSSFTDKANVVYSNIQQLLAKAHNSIPPLAYLKESGLDRLFPQAAAYMSQPTAPITESSKSEVDKYVHQLSCLNHTLALARQIHQDLTYQGRPKYLAHQLAVLYQSLGSFPSGGKVLERHRTNIEENFKALKGALADIADDEDQILPTEVREWVLDLTDSISQIICSLPEDVTKEILPVAQVLNH